MKNLNPNLNKYIGKYFDKSSQNLYVKIIGKISFNRDFINFPIKDNDIGLFISANRTEINTTEKKDLEIGKKKIIEFRNDIEVKIITENGENKIYERDETNEIKEENEIKGSLFNPHVILYKFDKKKYKGKKRKADSLFNNEILKLKK